MKMSIQSPHRNGLFQRLSLLAIILSALMLNIGLVRAQSSPPSRPILFVHGFCGDAGSWANLVQALSVSVAKDHAALYPYLDTNNQQKVYRVYYDSVADQVFFVDPDTGGTVDEMWILPSTRFFEIAFYDSANASFDPTVVANISILNKAYELSRVIKEITKITQIKDVIVVAHSMGGLVARAYMENLASSGYCWDPGTPSTPDYTTNSCKPGGEPGETLAQYGSDIADVITIDTPHGGTLASNVNISNTVCALEPSTTKTEMIPGSSLIQTLNFYTDPNGQLPSATTPTIPIQSIESYFNNEPNPGPAYCQDAPTDNSGLTFYCDDLINSNHQAIRQNLEPTHRAELSNWLDLGNPFNDQDPNIAQNATDCFIPMPLGLPPLRMLHLIQCLGNQSQTQTNVYDQIDPIVAGQLTSLSVKATYNGQPWAGALSYTILFQDYSSKTETTVPLILNDVSVGTYSLPAYDISGGPVSDGPPTVTATPSPTIKAGQWATTFTVAFTKTTPSSTTTTVSVSAPKVSIGQTLTISATILANKGQPTGTVTFYDSGKTLGTGIVNNVGIAAYNTNSLALGSHSITAQYSGDSNYSASTTSSAVTITVVAVAPQLSVSPTSGTPGVTSFVKTDTGFTPYKLITHTATFPDNSVSVLQTNADLNGSYSYSRTYSMIGLYSQTDTDVTTGQTTKAATWTVSPVVTNDFSLTVSPSSQSVLQSGSVSYNVVTTTTSGTAQTVSFGASNLPSGLNATFSPTSLTTGSQSTLTITASASAPVGTYPLVIAASSSYTTHTYQISVTVAQAQTGPVMTVTPSILRFNDQSVGTISSPQTVVLRNSGTGQLIITGIGLASGNTDYALNLSGFSSPLILNQGVTYSLPVYFEPASAGTRSGQIVIYDNAPGSPQVVSLTGNGLAAQPSTGTINVIANLNGVTLPALYYYQYSLAGPTAVTGYDNNSFSVTAGTYSITFGSNPSYFTLASVTPSSSQSVVAGGTTTFTLNFSAPNDFYPPSFLTPVGGGSTAQVVPAGSTATYTIGVAAVPHNASSPVTLSVVGAPLDSTPVFSPQPVYSGTDGTLTIGTTSGSTPAGVYVLTVSGTNQAGVTHVDPTTSVMAVTAPPRHPGTTDQ